MTRVAIAVNAIWRTVIIVVLACLLLITMAITKTLKLVGAL